MAVVEPTVDPLSLYGGAVPQENGGTPNPLLLSHFSRHLAPNVGAFTGSVQHSRVDRAQAFQSRGWLRGGHKVLQSTREISKREELGPGAS